MRLHCACACARVSIVVCVQRCVLTYVCVRGCERVCTPKVIEDDHILQRMT